jgi:hypothetical protein
VVGSSSGAVAQSIFPANVVAFKPGDIATPARPRPRLPIAFLRVILFSVFIMMSFIGVYITRAKSFGLLFLKLIRRFFSIYLVNSLEP